MTLTELWTGLRMFKFDLSCWFEYLSLKFEKIYNVLK